MLGSPTARDIAVVASLLLLVAALSLWQPLQQGSKAVADGGQSTLPVATIEVVLDAPPTQTVTINGYPPLHQFSSDEGYHLVFVVPSNKTYVLSPACCSRLRYLTPGKRHYAYWMGGCVALRTDK